MAFGLPPQKVWGYFWICNSRCNRSWIQVVSLRCANLWSNQFARTWSDGDYNQSEKGKTRAIPAKHVRAAFEIKGSLNSDTARDAISKLSELNNLADHLPASFSCGTIFFDLDTALVGNQSVLPNLLPSTPSCHMLCPTKENGGSRGDLILGLRKANDFETVDLCPETATRHWLIRKDCAGVEY